MTSSISTNTDDFSESLDSLTTLVHILRWRAVNQPGRLAYTFLPDGEVEDGSLTYEDLDRQARAIAARLQSAAASGERALLLFPSGREFVAAFFGCLYAGVIAVPAYPPDPSRLNRTLPRFRAIAADAQPVVALTTSALLPLAENIGAQCPDLRPIRWLTTDDIGGSPEQEWREPALTGGTVAFLQYTSGSTSAPKGVMVTHSNLMHNERVIKEACRHSQASTFVSWLPLYHDMGLIGTVLQPLYLGARGIIMPPVAFLQNPFRWLQAISRYKAATSGGPNFAYDLCARKITPEQSATLDLSSWTTAFNGAEPVRPETLDRFVSAFGHCGFRREAFFPCYGLAEATLIVSASSRDIPPVMCTVQPAGLEHNRVALTSAGGEAARTLVSCGHTLLGQKIVVVNPEDLTRSSPDEVGEIWVSGHSVTPGYWNRPEETERTFNAYLADTGEGPFLRTGDMGFVRGGELFITGRLKDLIIIRGRNHYPQDIELTVESSHRLLRPGCGAAFSVEAAGEEHLVVVQEVDDRRSPDADEIIGAIRREVAEAHDLQVYSVVLIKPGTIPKTSSGKIQRHSCRAALKKNDLDVVIRWEEDLEREPRPLTLAQPESAKAIESWLASRLAAKLGVDPSIIAVDHPIARHGLDSLMTTELMHEIESGLGVALPSAGSLLTSTITQIADRAFNQLTTSNAGARPIIARTKDGAHESPLSYGQRALWFLHKFAPESAAYNVSAAARIDADLNAQALRRAFQALVDRHPSLRSNFSAPAGEPVRIINERADIYFQEEDASAWDEAMIEKSLTEEAHRPFDLEQGPMLRITLLRRSALENILLLVAHHIAIDFWSLGVLLRELAALYEAESNGTSATLAPLRLQYVDYVHWQAEMLAGSEGERLWAYWKEQLAGELPALNLPADRPRPAVQTYRGASHIFKVSAEETEALKALARTNNATLYGVLLAAFQVLLYRYSGQDDILVGSPAVGRTRAEFGNIVGYFVNPLVMRADLSADPTFETFLSSVRQTVSSALDHQDYPFNLLVERLEPERDPSRSPLFQAMFVLQKAPPHDEQGLAAFALGEAGAKIQLGSLSFESTPLRQRVAQFDLTLAMAEAEGGLAGSLQYNTDLFDAATIGRVVESFGRLLGSIVAEPRQRVSQLPLLADSERRLLAEWNQTRVDYPDRQCMHQLFEAQAELSPDAIAVVFKDRRLSYGELNRRANRLAHRLRAMGVGPEVSVGVCMHRSLEMVVALLGILKSGGVYVPLDPQYPYERLAFMMGDSRMRALLTERQLATLWPAAALPAEVVCLDLDADAVAQESNANPHNLTEPDNLAYVIYTSGSTGTPKGVAIQHRSAVSFLYWAKDVFSREERAGVLASTSICFDLSVFELFFPLSWGGRVILVENVLRLRDAGRENDVRLINTVPSAMAELVSLGAVPASVRTVNLAGEALRNKLVQQIYRQQTVERVFNLYGPSEDTTYSTFALINKNTPCEPPIGRPISNTQAFVLGGHLQPVPVGVAGELHLGGGGLARGYLNRPELTAEKFIPDPLGDAPGARLYKTGDLARHLPGGDIDFLGRIDHQVKVRGFRIELGEVEASLGRHPAVHESVVEMREDGSGDRRLVAYVAVGDDELLTANELRGFMKERLPDYMVPSSFVLLKALPLTPNGKVDRRMLPPPAWSGSDSAESFTAPRTPIEEVLSRIWCEVLGVGRLSVYDNFFHIGGHSLLAIKVISRVQDALRLELPLSSLFESPDVARLAEKVSAAMEGGRSGLLPPIERIPHEGALPLSFAQQRLWLLDQLGAGSPAYNLPFVIRLKGPLDQGALGRSINEIFARHEALRATFITVDGQPMQVIAPPHVLAVRLTDLARLPESEREAEAMRLASEEVGQPFDLTRGPLLRAALLRLGGEDHIAVITTHHIASDGWSTEVFARELAALYRCFSEGGFARLPELPIQYADFARWQRESLRGPLLDAQLAYWKRQLAAAPPVLDIPTDRPRPAVPSFEGGVEAFKLSGDVSRLLKELSRASDVTLFMTLTAAFKVLLYRYSRQTDVVVGTPVANRNRVEVEPLIGFFSNMLVLRTDMGGAPDFVALLKRVRDTAVSAYAHQDLPVEKLVDELQPERSLSHTPLFQVVLALHDDPLRRVEIPGLALSHIMIHTGTAKFDLLMNFWEEDGQLMGALEYSSDLFDARTAERMVGNFKTLIEGIVADPNTAISALPLLTQSERKQLLGWNNSDSHYPQELCLHELFEEQAGRTPDAVALVFDQDCLTYRQLNRRADELARLLRALGVGPERFVALCLDRCLDMIVALLAVLKAGAAYVPLDPLYPKQRLAYILEETSPTALITHAELIDRLPPHSASVVKLDCPDQAAALQSNAEGGLRAMAESPAYVIYTSGSTGSPKGVVVTHRNVSRLMQATQGWFEFGQQDVWTLFHSYAFDFSVWEIWGALLNGGRLVIVPYMVSRTPEAFYEMLEREQVSVLNQTPSAFRQLMQVEERQHVERRLSLREVILGGEALELSSLKGWVERRGDERPRIVNMYGITETTVHVTYRVVREEDVTGGRGSVIGEGIRDLQVMVLDEHLEPVPIGVAGEIYVGGEGLARGYLKRGEMSAERFIPNPYSSKGGGRLYRTGDLGKYDEKGELEYVGRADQQVKVRGYRIELGEIEARIKEHRAIRDSVVVVREEGGSEKRLVAYVVTKGEVTEGEIREHLRERLPEYMVPAAYVKMGQMPLTANGKVDRRALPAPESQRPALGSPYVEPHTETEKVIAGVWQQVLRVEKVGANDNFFDLGGDSFLMAQACGKLREALDRNISMVEAFTHTSVSSLARHLSYAQPASAIRRQSDAQVETRKEAMKQREQLRKRARMKGKS